MGFEAKMGHAMRRIMMTVPVMLGLGLALTGCGFKPMYAETTQAGAREQLEAINVVAPGTPLGREVQYDLFNVLNTQGLAPTAPLYQLNIMPVAYEQDVAVELNTNVSRRNYVLSVQFMLIDLSNNKMVFKGSSQTASSYNRFESEFANMSASDGTMKRTASTVADDIKTQLAVYFTRQSGK